MCVVRPDNHRQILARGFAAGPAEADASVRAAAQAAPDWSRLPLDERASVFLRAADLLAEPWRDTLNGATMLGQSKTIHQAEIDSACELADFWRFSVAGARVLVVDDTWTTGAHAQSASCGLKAADAAAVGVLAIGRSFTTDYRDNNSGW